MHGRVNWHGISMARGFRARKRIERVLASAGALPAVIRTPILVRLALCALPLVWLTGATRPVLVARFDSVASRPLTQSVVRLRLPPLVPGGPNISPLAPVALLKGSSFPDEKTGQRHASPQAAISEVSTGFYP